jgi:hypothetical protein
MRGIVFLGVFGALCLACGSGDQSGDSGTDGQAGGDGSMMQDTGSSMDSGGMQDTGSGNDSGMMGNDGGFNPSCSGTGTSACGKPQSIMRVVTKLGGMLPDATGDVVVMMTHYRLGSGSTGGVFHTMATKTGTVGVNTTLEVDFDMCAGGEMWSEENCEFNLWAFVDKNKNQLPDQGEPAGRIITNVSCKVSGMQCFGIVMDCTNGNSCISFQDPGACKCANPGCNSAIKTCM